MEKDVSTLTNPQLQDQLRKLGLKVSGNKPDLIKRIQRTHRAGSIETEYSQMSVKQLKDHLLKLGLPVSGKNKAELVKRIKDYEASRRKSSHQRKLSPKRRDTPSPKREENSSPKRGLATLPPELNIEIFLNLDDKSLARACRTNKEAAKICKDDLFWKSRIERIFGYYLSKYREEKDVTYRKMYKFLKKDQYIDEALELGYLPIVKYLMDEEGLRIDIDAAFVNAAKNGHLPLVIYLIERVSDIYFLNEALIQASKAGKLPVVKYIFDREIHYPEALAFASGYGKLSVVQYLIENGINIHYNDDEALRMASMFGYLPIVKYLIEKGANIHVREDNPIEEASSKRHLPVVEYLVEHGADINVSNAIGHAANAARANLQVVKYLVEHGGIILPSTVQNIRKRAIKNPEYLKTARYLEQQLQKQ